jgi:tetratricopeptide (TPR) repeat protein
MRFSISRWRRSGLLSLALGLAVVSVGAQGRGSNPNDLFRHVRAALAHGDVAGARRLAMDASADPARHGAALAIVEIFEGKYEDARARLLPLAAAAPLGEASLELGLLDMRTGRRAEGRRRLMPITNVRTFSGPDDYFRLARAARANREFLLANDAYQRVNDEPRADIQTEWGDMFVERHQPGDAVTSYNRALEIDARWVPALVGLARAFADQQPPAARKALAAAVAAAPDHPDVWLVTAEQRLESEDAPGAREALDRLAAVRPGTVEEAALRVAIAYKEGGVAAVPGAVAAVRAIDPGSALGYRLASEQAARDYRFDDSAALAREATLIDGEDAASFFALGLALMRTGDEPAARTALEQSWDLDKSSVTTKNLLEVLDRLDKFEIVSHGDFIFRFAPGEAAVLRTYALPLADEAFATFVKRYGFRPEGPIHVQVFDRHDDFAVRTMGLPGLVGALGACFGRVVTMDSPRARPPGDFSWQATLWHELAHVFSLHLSDYRVPRWLTEGISVYEEHRRQPAWGRELTLEFAHLLSKGQTFGVKKLPEAFKRPETLAMAYFEASLVVEHLVSLNGEGALRALLQAYAGGAKDADAFAKAFGRSVDEVDQSFAAFIEERYGALKRAMADPPKQVPADDLNGLRARAAEAPGNYISQLALGRALVRAGDLDGARAPLERAAALAPTASGQDSPKALLAAIAEKTNPAEARRWLRELLAHDYTNLDAARRLVALARAAKATDEEDLALGLISALDPFDAETHGSLGARLLAKGQAADALLEFQATVALGPANPAEAHANVAEALLKLGRRSEARSAALTALKIAPTYARAQDLLLEASGN